MQSASVAKPKWTEGGAMTSGCKANAETVVRLLNEALATEVICILRYKRHYFMTAGVSGWRVKAKFLQYVAEGAGSCRSIG